MTQIPRSIFFIAFLSTALNGCSTSVQKELGTVGDNEFSDLAAFKMLQPEHFMKNGISSPYILSSQHMLGLSANDVQKMFGAPNFKHSSPQAEIWQYRKDSCLLDFFLYMDKNQPTVLRVKHVEARGRSVAKISQNNCFLSVLNAKF